MSTFDDLYPNKNTTTKDSVEPKESTSKQHDNVNVYTLSFSENSVRDLLSRAVGYFDGEEDSSIGSNNLDTVDSIDSFNKFRKNQERHENEDKKTYNEALYFSKDSVMTPSQLIKELEWALDSAGGRLSLTQFRLSLSLYKSDGIREIDLAAKQLISSRDLQKVSSSSTGDVELLSSEYWNTWIEKEMLVQLMQDGGRLSISQLSAEKNLSPKIILSYLKHHENNGELFTVCVLGSKATYVVSLDYLAAQEREIFQILSDASVPADLDDLVKKKEWNKSRTINCVLELCQTDRLNGVMNNNLFVPNTYVQKQRELVNDFFTANGYVTMGYCRSMIGLSSYSKVKEYLNENELNSSLVICFERIFVNHDAIILPLKAAVQHCIGINSFVDLKMLLPKALTASSEHHDECVNVIKNTFPNNKYGVIVISTGEIIFFSFGMIQSIKDNIMPELIKNHAEMVSDKLNDVTNFENTTRNTSDGEVIIKEVSGKANLGMESKKEGGKKGARESNNRKLSAKEKRRRKKELLSSSKIDKREHTTPYVSLTKVANKILEEYPGLHALQKSYGMFNFDEASESAPSWLENDESNSSECRDDGPLYNFCRVTLDSPNLRKTCFDAVQDNINKVLASKKEAAQRKLTIQKSFQNELCFGTACYMVQLLSKLPTMRMNGSFGKKLSTSVLEDDFLLGIGSLFARKITEYSLFRLGLLDKQIFHFQAICNGNEISTNYDNTCDLPNFCNLFDTSQRKYEGCFLSCVSNENEDESTDALKLLREKLPGKVGVDLARMWSYCGGHCFQGGRRKTEDGSEFITKGKYTLFLKHIRECCKSMCSLDFMKIEKKPEKQLLFTRRQKLSKALEDSTDPREIFDITIMLLFQKVKGIVVAGNELPNVLLDLLLEEKTVPDQVRTDLRFMAKSLNKKDKIPTDLKENIRKYGLAHNISLISGES